MQKAIYTTVGIDELLSHVQALKGVGARFVQMHAERSIDDGTYRLVYTFIDVRAAQEHIAQDGSYAIEDQPLPDGNGTLGDYIPDRSKPMEEVIADRMLLEQLFARLRELDPEADTIIQLWKDHPEGISDRAIARELGRPQKTFADQMKKYRTDLRRITGDK